MYMKKMEPHVFIPKVRECLNSILVNSNTDNDAAMRLVMTLKKCGIEIIAADFDQTILTKHSGGCIREDDESVLKALSTDFDDFGRVAESEGMRISVVTFADDKFANGRKGLIAGEALVRATLKESSATFSVGKVYAYNPALYQDPEAYKAIGLAEKMKKTKSFHLQKVAEFYGVRREKIVLIDDDYKNCRDFFLEGGLSIHVSGYKGFRFSKLAVVDGVES